MPAKDQETPVLSMNLRIERDRALIVSARARGRLATLGAYVRLSGPGWLQSAVTLGGGSLSSCMYLGVLVGFSFLWLQPIAMAAGIVMLSAIAYVTLSTGERPLRAINKHVNPVLGWSWLLASMVANLVWSMPQFALATASFQQNLFPGVFGPEVMPDPWGKLAVCGIILAVALTAGMLYSIGGWGMRVFEVLVKCMVGVVVVCFVSVTIKLVTTGGLAAGEVFRGFIPDLRLLFEPVEALAAQIAHVAPQYQGYWEALIVSQQRDVMISAGATAVGINMTFLFPYSMLRKGWDRDFRGLAIFDLSTGLFFPFVLATSCVIVASAARFHAEPAPGFLGETDAQGRVIAPAPNLVGGFNALLEDRLAVQIGAEAFQQLSPEEKADRLGALPEADRRLAAMLVTRDAFNLADSLTPLTGETVARYVFGLGVLGMGMGAATMLMLINGLCFCELLNRPARGWRQRAGMLMVSVGILGPFFWKSAQMWIAIPTSIFAMTLLPLAYLSFFLLMNQRRLMGEHLPRGGKRVLWNVVMAFAVLLAGFGSLWAIWSKAGWYGLAAVILFTVAVVVVHVARKNPDTQEAP